MVSFRRLASVFREILRRTLDQTQDGGAIGRPRRRQAPVFPQEAARRHGDDLDALDDQIVVDRLVESHVVGQHVAATLPHRRQVVGNRPEVAGLDQVVEFSLGQVAEGLSTFLEDGGARRPAADVLPQVRAGHAEPLRSQGQEASFLADDLDDLVDRRPGLEWSGHDTGV